MARKKTTGSASKKRRRTAAIDKQAIELAEHMATALQYRRLGYTYQQISETMERPVSTVARWVTEAIKAIPQKTADEVRKLMLDRLDHLMQGLMRAVDEDSADSSTITALLAIEERRAKLLGLYTMPDYFDGAYADEEVRHRRQIELLQAHAPVLRHDEPIPLQPIL
jgi:hypothetical protein